MAVVLNDQYGNSNENDVVNLWSKSSELLKRRLDPQIFTAWIKPLSLSKSAEQFRDINVDEFELVAPNKFCRDHIRKHYADLITATISDVIGDKHVRVSIKSSDNVRPNLNQTITPRPIERPAVAKQTRPDKSIQNDSNLNLSYNFSNFVVGSCNQFAHAASLKVAEQPGTIYNPLFVYGGVGLGKTHLVNAIGNAARRRGKKVLFVSSEYFLNELIHSVRTNTMPEFKKRFRSLDVLIVDDIQFIIGKERTQEEFFHTFNELHQKGRQIIVTSDKLPQELTGLEERIRTRFASGLSVDLQAPDFETRVAILVKKSESTGLSLPTDVAQFLAQQVDTNIRELEGALNRLRAVSSVKDEPITVDLARQTLSLLCKQSKKEVTTDKIQDIVASYYRVSSHDLLGKRRTSNIAMARHVAMFLCRSLLGRSYLEIGAIFGGRDHSTVIHACKTIEDKCSIDSKLAEEIEQIKKHF